MSEPWAASGTGDVAERARRWLTGDAMRAVVDLLGGPPPSLADLTVLRDWSRAVLDARQGAERREARALDVSDEARAALLESAVPLGLVRTAPPTERRYDLVVILAGTTTGNRLRTLLARDVLGRVRTSLLVALASDRPLMASELDDDPASAADRTEGRNLLRYLDTTFGLVPDPTASAAGPDAAYRTRLGLPLRVLVAPDQRGRRPTTAQQLAFMRERIDLHQRRTSLLVTSAIYAPYQFFAGAPQVLADGASSVELIGTDTRMSGDRRRLAQRIGQEIHAAIEAASDAQPGTRPRGRGSGRSA